MNKNYILSLIIVINLLLSIVAFTSCAKKEETISEESFSSESLDYEKTFTIKNTESIENFLKENKDFKREILSKNNEISKIMLFEPEIWQNSALDKITIHGTNLYYWYYKDGYKPSEKITPDEEIKRMKNGIIFHWNFSPNDTPKENLEYFVKQNKDFVFPVDNFAGMYYSNSDYPENIPPICKMFYWIQDGYTVGATVPTELADKFLQNLKENGSNFLKLIDI